MTGNHDIRKLTRPISRYPKMPRRDRAKIFAPFAALSGFEDSVHARDRVLVPRIIPGEDAREQLDRKLRRLRPGDYVTAVYFLPEKITEEGAFGAYRTVSSLFLKIDALEGTLHLDGATIPLEDVAELTGEALERTEDHGQR